MVWHPKPLFDAYHGAEILQGILLVYISNNFFLKVLFLQDKDESEN